MAGGWEGSSRSAELPPDWPDRRDYVWARDEGLCQWSVDRDLVCGLPGRDIDHIDRHRGHELENLRVLCGWHHDRKSSAEGNAARERRTERLPVGKHPGLL